VEEHELLCLYLAPESDGLIDSRVPPADLAVVLVLEILRVVQHEVDATSQGATGNPVERPAFNAGQCRLVIGQIGETRRSGLEPGSDCRPWVHDEIGTKSHAFDQPRFLGERMEHHASWDIS